MKGAEFDEEVDAVAILKVYVAEHDIEPLSGGTRKKRPHFRARPDRRDFMQTAREVFANLAPQVGIVFHEEDLKRHGRASGWRSALPKAR